jgi:hypothetical protein
VAVIVSPAENERFFTPEDCARLRKKIAHRLPGQPDAALRVIVSDVRAVLHDNEADRQGVGGGGDLFLAASLGAGVGLWALVGLLRRRMGSGAAAPPDLKPALLASRFGLPTGFWVFDRDFLAHRASVPPAAPGLPPTPTEPAGEAAVEDEDAPVAVQEET